MIIKMSAFYNFFIIFLYMELIREITAITTSLTSVNISYYARQLYERVGNEATPFVHDPVILDPQVRGQICKDITSNGIFVEMQLTACSPKDWYLDQVFPTFMHYNSSLSYFRRQFPLSLPLPDVVEEYVFLCLVKHSTTSRIIPFYVSKEYDVGPANHPHDDYKPGRFVFGNFSDVNGVHHVQDDFYVMLAEEPGNFLHSILHNIELYYLNLRKHIEPVEDYDVGIDPLCGLISADRFDAAQNQYARICMAVCTMFYKRFSHDATYHSCVRQEVSFETADGVRASAGRSYFERMTLCHCAHLFSIIRANEVYISRSYSTGRLLMYYRNSSDGKIYLKGMSSNISLVDEINSFDFVED